MADQDLDYCFAITRQSGSNLWFVGKTLPKMRQAMFVSAYASMRVIDDYVDDEFAIAEAHVREESRKEAHQRVGDWLQTVQGALKERGKRVQSSGLDERIAQSLNNYFANSDIGPAPWEALANAMHWDIDERRFGNWRDFKDYCEGATVAPASIFLYVLAGKAGSHGEVTNGLPAPAADCARDMAVFCYLVHIARDLLKDAGKDANLVTIPEAVLEHHGLAREEMINGRALSNRSGLLGLVIDLIEYAKPFRKRGEIRRDEILPLLGVREALALRALMAVYCALHDRLTHDPEIALSSDPAVREQLRRDALAAADVQV